MIDKIWETGAYQEYLFKLAKEFDEIKFSHIGRYKNQFVDVLANLAFMDKVDCGNIVQPISIEVKKFFSSLFYSQRRSGWESVVLWYQILYTSPEVSPGGIQYIYENHVKVSHGLLPRCRSVI